MAERRRLLTRCGCSGWTIANWPARAHRQIRAGYGASDAAECGRCLNIDDAGPVGDLTQRGRLANVVNMADACLLGCLGWQQCWRTAKLRERASEETCWNRRGGLECGQLMVGKDGSQVRSECRTTVDLYGALEPPHQRTNQACSQG